MQYVAREEARKAVERELRKAKQLRHAQVREQTVMWTEEIRKRFEDEKERQVILLAEAITAQAQANTMAEIEQLNIQHDLAMAKIGEAHRAASELREAQQMKELKRLQSGEVAKQRGSLALKAHRLDAQKRAEGVAKVLKRKEKVRMIEDMKAKDLVERKPFTVSNVIPGTGRNPVKGLGPPEYQQTIAKSLRLAPAYENQQENSKTPITPKKSLKAKSVGKLKSDGKVSKLEPPFGAFVKEAELRQSNFDNANIKPKTQVTKTVEHTSNQKMTKPIKKKEKVQPVSYYDASVPKSGTKYIPPQGLVERIKKDSNISSAWDTAKEKLEQKKSEALKLDLRNDDEKSQDNDISISKSRGKKALRLEQLSRELRKLTHELTKQSSEVPNSLSSAKLGLDDNSEIDGLKAAAVEIPKPIVQRDDSPENMDGTLKNKSFREIESSQRSRKSSSSSVTSQSTDFYSPTTTPMTSRDHTPTRLEGKDIPIKEIDKSNNELFDNGGDVKELETSFKESLKSLKINEDQSIEKVKGIDSKLLDKQMPELGEAKYEKIERRDDREPDMTPERESAASSEKYSDSYNGDTKPRKLSEKSEHQRRTTDTLSSKEIINSDDEINLLKLKLTEENINESKEMEAKINVLKTNISKKKKQTPKQVDSSVESGTSKSDDYSYDLTTIRKPQTEKPYSDSTTEYYSPPFTSTPDGSKSRISDESAFKVPLGKRESKALNRYVTKMMHMRRESVERLPVSVSRSSSSDNSKIIADSFQSEWSSYANTPQSNSRGLISTHLNSTAVKEESSYSPVRHSSSESTVANISLKIHPLSSNVNASQNLFGQVHDSPQYHNSPETSLEINLKVQSETRIESETSREFSSNNGFRRQGDQSVGNWTSHSWTDHFNSSKGTNGVRKSSQSSRDNTDSERSLTNVGPIINRIRSTDKEDATKDSSKTNRSSFSGQKPSGSDSDKEVLRGGGDSISSDPKLWRSPIYNVVEHAEMLSSVFSELRTQWANISIERPPWCS